MRKKNEGHPTQIVHAYLTVYTALVLAILVLLFLAMLEGVRINTIQLEAELIADIGMDSVLAEYHRELWNQYGMLWIDTAYGTNRPDISSTKMHLQNYLKKNCDMNQALLGDYLYRDFIGLNVSEVVVEEVAVATDEEGRFLREQAVEIVKNETGIDAAEQVLEWLGIIEDYHLDQEQYLERKIDDSIEEMMSYDGQRKQIGNEWITIEVENPVKILDTVKNKGILNLVAKDAELSTACIDDATLISRRYENGQVNQGNWSQTQEWKENWIERFFWQEYLLRYLGRYGNTLDKRTLQYQLEYVIAGKNSDVDNLKSVVHRISGIREAANTLYIFSDKLKCAEAEAIAMLTTTALSIPEAEPLFRGIILLAWAYAESLYDIKCLLAGKSIPLLKTEGTWHYSLGNILNGEEFDEAKKGVYGKSEDEQKNQEAALGEGGLRYEDYLRILLALSDISEQTFRTMNVMEMDIRQTSGNSAFRIDGCIDRLKVQITLQSAYGYTIHLQKRKGY